MNSCNDFTPKFIEVPPLKPLQVEFVPLVDDARFSLRTELGTLLDSLYLYGSVSRASAQLGQSDLDLTLILTRPLSAQESHSLECSRIDLEARHPEVSKVDFDIGIRQDVLNPANINSWGYWLKYECRCIYGADAGLQFPDFLPSKAIAEAVNGDYFQALSDYGKRIANANTHAEMQRLQKEAARKLVRATNVLRAATDIFWPRTLEDYVRNFSVHHPEMAEQISFFLRHAQTPSGSSTVFIENLYAFTNWMQHHQSQCNSA